LTGSPLHRVGPSYDDVAAWAHGVLDSLDVGIALLRRSKKVKHRAVVPDVERLGRQLQFENVTFEPRNPARRDVSHSRSCPIQRGSRQVQNCNVAVTLGNEVVDEGGVVNLSAHNSATAAYTALLAELKERQPAAAYFRGPSKRPPPCSNVIFAARAPSIVKMNRSARSKPTPKVSFPK